MLVFEINFFLLSSNSCPMRGRVTRQGRQQADLLSACWWAPHGLPLWLCLLRPPDGLAILGWWGARGSPWASPLPGAHVAASWSSRSYCSFPFGQLPLPGRAMGLYPWLHTGTVTDIQQCFAVQILAGEGLSGPATKSCLAMAGSCVIGSATSWRA